jgi:hypothetical protein
MRKASISILLLSCGAALAAPQWVPVGSSFNGKVEAFSC